MARSYTVAIDWNRNGVWTNVGDDVTDRLRGRVAAEFGRDQTTALSPIVSGRGAFDLDNRSRDYSPLNASSPLSPNVLPARPVRMQCTVGGTTYGVFLGHTDDAPLNPDLDTKTVGFTLVDSIADFRGQTVTTQLYQGIRSGTAIGKILDAAGWTGGRDLDTGGSVFPWWWEEGADAFDALAKVLASEGPPALLTIGPAGEIVFRDRHHRYVRSSSTTVQATWRGAGVVEPVMNTGFVFSSGWQNIVNNVTVGVDERRQAALDVIWSTDEVIDLNSGESVTYVFQTSDPFQGLITPDKTIDYGPVSRGTLLGLNASLSRTSGAASSLTISAVGVGAAVAGIQVRGYSVPVVRTLQVSGTDATSIARYGQRSLPSNAYPVWASRYDAKAIVDLFMAQRAAPLPIITSRFVLSYNADAKASAVLALDLSDRVTVVEPETGVNGDYFVESLSHSFTGVTDHVVTVGVEAVPTTPTGTQFKLDTSTLNGAHVLGY